MKIRRHSRGAALVIAAVLSVTSTLGVEATSQEGDTTPGGVFGSSVHPLIPPPPLIKPTSDISGRTDLPLTFQPGAIRVRISKGARINEIMAKHGLRGPAEHWLRPPFNRFEQAVGLDRSYQIRVAPGSEKALVSQLHRNKTDFEFVYMMWNVPVTPAFEPNDPYWTGGPNLDYLRSIGMPRAWDRTKSNNGIVIAVADGGVNGAHADMPVSKQKVGYSFLTGGTVATGINSDTGCANYHGSHVASVAAAGTNNAVGIVGTGFDSAYMPIVVFDANCQGFPARRGDVIREAQQRGAQVINMSYTTPYPDTDEQDAITAAWAAGVTPVAAAGNDDTSFVRYPCAHQYVVCVGNTDSAGTLQCGSNYSPTDPRWIDVTAPGLNVWGVAGATNDQYKFGCGTSFSAPIVAGVMALLRHLGKTPQQQYEALANTANQDRRYSAWGYINAGAALFY